MSCIPADRCTFFKECMLFRSCTCFQV
uniref:Uncharacterized protein n=1 Tax=Lotus japonicus TaxID=34305 RepID=I3SI85_LOTJA|nr:unknown [Lotus japonicus]